jgi:hypothetical protein
LLQLSVSSLGFDQSAALFFQALFEITNLLLETNRHSCYCWANGVAQHNFGLSIRGICLARFPQLRHLLNLATGAVAGVDDKSFAINLARPNKFLEGIQRCRSVITLVCKLDQPVHPELGQHRRFHPGMPIVGKRMCGAICAAAAQRATRSKRTGPKVLPSSCLRRNQL